MNRLPSNIWKNNKTAPQMWIIISWLEQMTCRFRCYISPFSFETIYKVIFRSYKERKKHRKAQGNAVVLWCAASCKNSVFGAQPFIFTRLQLCSLTVNFYYYFFIKRYGRESFPKCLWIWDGQPINLPLISYPISIWETLPASPYLFLQTVSKSSIGQGRTTPSYLLNFILK